MGKQLLFCALVFWAVNASAFLPPVTGATDANTTPSTTPTVITSLDRSVFGGPDITPSDPVTPTPTPPIAPDAIEPQTDIEEVQHSGPWTHAEVWALIERSAMAQSRETARQKQCDFTEAIAALIMWATDPDGPGLRVTFGYRGESGTSIYLNFWKDGNRLTTITAHREIGNKWKQLGGSWTAGEKTANLFQK